MADNTQVAETFKNMPTLLSNKLDAVKDALPQGFNKARFIQNCIALLNDDPDKFKQYSPATILTGLLKASYLDLNFYANECYLIPYGKKLNFQTSYTGSMKLAKKYSSRPVKEIYSKLICEGDEFEEIITNGEQSINYKPKFPRSKNIIGAFAVVVYKDGGLNYDVMTLEELETTRKHSKAANSGAWKDFTGEMYRKTVLRRLCKYIDLNFENASQQEVFNEDAAIETDPLKIHDAEVEENANSEEFIDMDASEVVVNG